MSRISAAPHHPLVDLRLSITAVAEEGLRLFLIEFGGFSVAGDVLFDRLLSLREDIKFIPVAAHGIGNALCAQLLFLRAVLWQGGEFPAQPLELLLVSSADNVVAFLKFFVIGERFCELCGFLCIDAFDLIACNALPFGSDLCPLLGDDLPVCREWQP